MSRETVLELVWKPVCSLCSLRRFKTFDFSSCYDQLLPKPNMQKVFASVGHPNATIKSRVANNFFVEARDLTWNPSLRLYLKSNDIIHLQQFGSLENSNTLAASSAVIQKLHKGLDKGNITSGPQREWTGPGKKFTVPSYFVYFGPHNLALLGPNSISGPGKNYRLSTPLYGPALHFCCTFYRRC